MNVVTNLALGLVGLAVWVQLMVLANYLSLKSKWFHDLFRGRETVLIKHGKVLEDNLKEVQYTGEELLSQLRRKNVFNLADALATNDPTARKMYQETAKELTEVVSELRIQLKR